MRLQIAMPLEMDSDFPHFLRVYFFSMQNSMPTMPARGGHSCDHPLVPRLHLLSPLGSPSRPCVKVTIGLPSAPFQWFHPSIPLPRAFDMRTLHTPKVHFTPPASTRPTSLDVDGHTPIFEQPPRTSSFFKIMHSITSALWGPSDEDRLGSAPPSNGDDRFGSAPPFNGADSLGSGPPSNDEDRLGSVPQ